MPYRAVVVSPLDAVREAIRKAVQRLGVDCVGEAAAPAEAASIVEALAPDVVIIGQRLADAADVMACRNIRDLSPVSKLITLTWYASDRDWLMSLLGGASACLLAQVRSVEEIASVIARVVGGEDLIHAERTGHLAMLLDAVSSPLEEPLRGVAALVFQLKTDSEIAETLGISLVEVRSCLGEIVGVLAPTSSLY